MRKAKLLSILALLLIAAGSAWADSESIWTNTKQSSYTSGNITIAVDAVGDGDGAYVSTDKMVISTSDGGNITQVVLRIGYYAESAGNVTANHGSCEVSGTGEKKETYVTITSINAPSVTVTSGETVQVDHVDVTYSPFIAVTGVSLSPTSAVMIAGQTTTLTATVAPANATNKSVTWTTSNASVATVANGVVTAVGVGTATITATTENGGYTATCAVTVDDPVTVAKYVGKVIAADGKVYKTLAAANKYSTASGIVAYYGSEVVETGQTYKAIAISLTNSERTNMYCGLDNTSCSGSTYGDIATALTVKNGIATTATTLETNVTHGYSHQLYYAAKETTPAPPAGASAWSIPSIGQWNLIIKGLTGSDNNLSTSANASFSASNVNAKIPTGADGFSELNYWSCTEKDNNKMWMMQFNGNGGLANNINKKNYATQGLRTMFAFTSATPVYIVNYDANGGSGAPDEQVKDDGSNLTLSSTVPTREGYTFVGWNTAADGSGTSYAAGATYTTDDDATLYAQWLMTAMIGCEGMVIAANGKMYKTLAAANKYSTASGIVAYYGSEVVETGQTYQAIAISLTDYRYNPDFMIYCGQSGSCSGHTYGDLATALTVKDGIATQATALSTNAAHGYSHQVAMAPGSNTSPRPTGASGWTIPSIGQWNLIMKGLTGTSLTTSANAALSTDNVNAALPSDATGFSQTLYWSNTEKDNSNMWMMQFTDGGGLAGYTAKNTGSYTLCRTMFAFTSATPAYVVSYDANGGSGAPDEQVRDGGTSLTLSSTVPTREGYTFAGWATTSDGAVAYAAGDAYTIDDDVTLYAQWTENTATLTDANDLTGLSAYAGKTCTVAYARSFTADKPSTLCLPFAFPTASASGKFYTFSDITKEGTEYIADMTEYTGTNLVANAPYLYKANATGEVDFGGTYEIPNPLTAGSIESNGWTFKGTFETIEWTEAPTGIYGFSAQNVDDQGISQGQFVKVGSYVRIKPMRCYLENESFAGARGMNRAAANAEQLPETIKVRLISANGDVTGIGSMSTKTGEVTMDVEAWYTIDGRRIEGKPSTKGIYMNNGKKVIIK